MKISSVALLAFAALERAQPVLSFVPLKSANVCPIRAGVQISAETEESDVSIPYDSAAEEAYKGWIEKYDTPYDAERYEVFKSNYEAITVMNMAAKKKARETGETPSLLSLNQFADCTAEEFEAKNKAESSTDDSSSETEEPASSGNILGDAVKAVESQASASSALQEAADALEAEEAVS
jgi:hypothetical protein